MSAAEALREMMAAWVEIMSAAKSQFPKANEEDLYQIVKGVMNYAIGK